MAKRILTKEQETQFKEWMEDGNVSKIDDNTYLEQTTQWRKEFTLDELKAFFKREYLSDSYYRNGGSVSEYKIYEGYDHYKSIPIYQVQGVGENEYVGEWHKDIKDAEKELFELINKGKFSGGGKTFVDLKYKISYRVQKSKNRDGWEVIESSPNWKEENILYFVTEEDAIQYAKLSAGIISEPDPEAYFLSKTEKFSKGGKITISDIKDGSKFKSKDGDIFIIDKVGEYDPQYKWTPVMTSWEGGSKGNYRDDINEVVSFLNELKAKKIFADGGTTDKMLVITATGLSKEIKERLISMGVQLNFQGVGYYLYVKSKDKQSVIDYLNTKNVEFLVHYGSGGSIEAQNYAMAQNDNKAIMHHSNELNNILKTKKKIPAWALALINQSSQNLSNVTHYLDGAETFATGGVSKKIYGDNVTFLDAIGNEQVGMVQDMDDKGVEVFYEERFMRVPTHKIVKFH